MTVSAQTAAISNVASRSGSIRSMSTPTCHRPSSGRCYSAGRYTTTITTGAATTPPALFPPAPAAAAAPGILNVRAQAKIAN